jgi:hypothetical protein
MCSTTGEVQGISLRLPLLPNFNNAFALQLWSLPEIPDLESFYLRYQTLPHGLASLFGGKLDKHAQIKGGIPGSSQTGQRWTTFDSTDALTIVDSQSRGECSRL